MLDIEPTSFPNEKYKQELWVYLTDNEVSNIVPNRYLISTWGKVFDTYSGKLYPSNKITKPDYPTAIIFLNDGTFKQIRIHILMISKFNCIRNIYATEIDHKDGVRYHNWIWNLEPVTHQENLKRAVDTNLYPTGEDHQNSIFTNDQIKSICKLIELGYSQKEILDQLESKIPNLKIHTIDDIKYGYSWTSISKNYDFSNAYRKNVVSKPMDCETVHKICSIFERFGINKTPKEVVKLLEIDWDSLDLITQNKFTNCIYRLKKKIIFKEICSKYDY